MKILGSMLALVALTASAPAFASDYSTDRHFTQGQNAIVRQAEARPAPPEAKKEAARCACSCARRMSDERPDPSRIEPGGH